MPLRPIAARLQHFVPHLAPCRRRSGRPLDQREHEHLVRSSLVDFPFAGIVQIPGITEHPSQGENP
jgi:hypothetical protein